MSDRRVRYARNGSVRLAYREFGEGDTTLVWNPGWFSNVDLVDEPACPITAVAEQLAEVTRLIVWDNAAPASPIRPPMSLLSMSEWMIFTPFSTPRRSIVPPFSVCPRVAHELLFAATYPERVHSLVMYGVSARFSQELPDYPWVLPPKRRPSIWKLSKVTGVKARSLSCFSAILPTYRDPATCMAGSTG